ncbi:hypothetical protein QBC43DRAFT_22993 [Cladorrhinum sp. PSN259]|nr:hypothetical protein QBC43DRAFT_22993 [Cladorrhinum sp. PSN259]
MENPAKEIKPIIKTLISGSPQEQSITLQKYFLPSASFTHPFCRVPSFESNNFASLDSRTLILQILKWYRFLSPQTSLTIESTVFDSKTNTLYIKTSQIFSIWFIPFHRTPPVNLVTVLQLEPSEQLPNGTKEGDEEHGDHEAIYDAAEETRHLIAEGEKPSFAEVVENGSEATASPKNGSNSHSKKEDKKQATASPKNWSNSHSKKEDKKQSRKERSSSRQGQQSQNGHAGSGTIKYYVKHYEDLYQVNEFLKFLTLGFGAWTYMVWQLFATFFCVMLVGILGPVMKLVAPKEWNGKGVHVH